MTFEPWFSFDSFSFDFAQDKLFIPNDMPQFESYFEKYTKTPQYQGGDPRFPADWYSTVQDPPLSELSEESELFRAYWAFLLTSKQHNIIEAAEKIFFQRILKLELKF